MAVLNVIATVYALLLAFVAVTVWQSFGAAETAVVNEPTASANWPAPCRCSTARKRDRRAGLSASTPTSS
jgi:hypothetical protein